MTDYPLFATTPSIASNGDLGAVSLSTAFKATGNAWVTHLGYLHPSGGSDSPSRQAALYSTVDGLAGTLVAGPLTLPVAANGQWGYVELPTPVKLTVGLEYRVSVFWPSGDHVATDDFFNIGDHAFGGNQAIGPVQRLGTANTLEGGNGAWVEGAAISFPNNDAWGACYYSTIKFTDVDPDPRVGGRWLKTATGKVAVTTRVN